MVYITIGMINITEGVYVKIIKNSVLHIIVINVMTFCITSMDPLSQDNPKNEFVRTFKEFYLTATEKQKQN